MRIRARIGGDRFDDAIMNYVRRNYGILIGEATAERIKIEIGSAYPGQQVRELSVKGRNLSEGVPRSFTLNSNEILEALQEPLQGIVSAVKQALEQTPPELGADVAERGIVLTGGGALLRDIDKLLMEETGLPVVIAEDPLTCVARGGGRILELMDQTGARALRPRVVPTAWPCFGSRPAAHRWPRTCRCGLRFHRATRCSRSRSCSRPARRLVRQRPLRACRRLSIRCSSRSIPRPPPGAGSRRASQPADLRAQNERCATSCRSCSWLMLRQAALERENATAARAARRAAAADQEVAGRRGHRRRRQPAPAPDHQPGRARTACIRTQPVVDASGVLGQVVHIGPWSSEVILITDPEHAIPVQVARNGLRTIAVGSGNTDELLPALSAGQFRRQSRRPADQLGPRRGVPGRLPGRRASPECAARPISRSRKCVRTAGQGRIGRARCC